MISETRILADQLDEAGFTELADAYRSCDLELGKGYLFRTVTYFWVGELAAITPKFFVLKKASWVANTGRYHNALRDGLESISESEVEPSPSGAVHVLIDGTIDITPYLHNLELEQK